MKMKSLVVYFAVTCLMIVPSLAQAADWSPPGSIKLQVGFGAGGSTDTLGRLVAASVEETTGWNVVVENKPGGGGVAMLSGLMNAKPDGLTIGLAVNVPILINLAKRGDKLPFKIDSFDYIGTITKAEVALVAKADAPFDDIDGFIELSKKKKMAIAFDASTQQMLMSAVKNQAGVEFKFIKHKSGAEQIQSILGGQGDCQGSYTQSGYHRCYVDIKVGKNCDSANCTDKNQDDPLKERKELFIQGGFGF